MRSRSVGWTVPSCDVGDPRDPRRTEFLEVLFAIEGAICDEVGRAIGRLEWRDVLGDDLTKVLSVAPMATEGFHAEGHPGLVHYHEVQHHLVEVRAIIEAVATRAVNHLCLRFLSPVVASIDLEASAIDMGKGRASPRR
jgi:hypothetical protein